MPNPDAPRSAWLTYAKFLAFFTIGYNLVEGLVSMGFGAAEDSLALFGFGADSFIEVGSACLVLWRLKESGGCADSARRRERSAALGIGFLFVALAVGIVLGSVLQLKERGHPATTLPGLLISAASLAFMFWLWRAKLRAARALDSRTLEGDAACSLACIQLSLVLFTGSLVYRVAPSLWWADAVAALGLALFIGREGIGLLRAARKPDFTGGCGCH